MNTTVACIECPVVVGAQDYHQFDDLIEWLKALDKDFRVKELSMDEVDEVLCVGEADGEGGFTPWPVDVNKDHHYQALIYMKGDMPRSKACRREFIEDYLTRKSS